MVREVAVRKTHQTNGQTTYQINLFNTTCSDLKLHLAETIFNDGHDVLFATVHFYENKTFLATGNVYPASATLIANSRIHSSGPPTCPLDIQGVSMSYESLLWTDPSFSSVWLWFFSNAESSTWVSSTFIYHRCCSTRPGYVPLGVRDQVLNDLPLSALNGIRCREVHLQGRDGANLSGILVHRDDFAEKDIEVILAYFQGEFRHSEDVFTITNSSTWDR